jgi:hypothetical protein
LFGERWGQNSSKSRSDRGGTRHRLISGLIAEVEEQKEGQMYCLFELLTVACLVAFVAAILFVACAAVILVNEGVRNVLRLSAAGVPRIDRKLAMQVYLALRASYLQRERDGRLPSRISLVP